MVDRTGHGRPWVVRRAHSGDYITGKPSDSLWNVFPRDGQVLVRAGLLWTGRDHVSGLEQLPAQVGQELAPADPELATDAGGAELAAGKKTADGLGRDPKMGRSVG